MPRKNKTTEEKLLQVANLSPDEDWIEKIVDVHPMKQVAIMSVVQAIVFFGMLGVMAITDLYLEGMI
jgi:hypothetical protein|tara:strand:+ start:14204 stop:14404 length:201 start_codon:yes stop_codon:yes gene_type:complete